MKTIAQYIVDDMSRSNIWKDYSYYVRVPVLNSVDISLHDYVNKLVYQPTLFAIQHVLSQQFVKETLCNMNKTSKELVSENN